MENLNIHTEAAGMLDVRLYRTSSSFAESCKNLTNNSLRTEQEGSSWLACLLYLLLVFINILSGYIQLLELNNWIHGQFSLKEVNNS